MLDYLCFSAHETLDDYHTCGHTVITVSHVGIMGTSCLESHCTLE